VAGLIFGFGAAGVAWLANLSGSHWFAGLAPRAEDLAFSGGVSRGEWAMPAAVGAPRDLGSATQAFFTSAPLPKASFASVAIPHGLGADEQAVAVGLVAALRERTDPEGRKMTVVATIETKDEMFTRRLLNLGAFVVRGAPGADSVSNERLHHYPSRAAITPRQGRLICVDLADFLYTWRPGFVGELHVLPFTDCEDTNPSKELLLPKVGVQPWGLNILFHLDLGAPGSPLVEMDRVATECQDVLIAEDVWMFTDTDWLDEQVDSIDLLIIQDASLSIENRIAVNFLKGKTAC
jgi:hypothetical protein